MMGHSHAITGAAVWLGGVALYSNATHTPIEPAVLLLGTAVAAGAAVAPDIDNYSSTIVNSLGFIGRGLYTIANVLGLSVYNLTRSRKDEFKDGGHRTFFHTTVAAILAGGLTALVSLSTGTAFTLGGKDFSWGQVFSLLIMALLFDLALGGIFDKAMAKYRRKYGPYLLLLASIIATVAIAVALPPADASGTYAWLGIAVGVGWFVHLLGDAITKMGVPMVWPIPWRGRNWYDVALPSFLRITAGGVAENWILLPIFSLAAVGLLIYDILLYSGFVK